jgi:hypothetical protein
MPNALRLETDIEAFFQKFCPDFADKAKKIFSDAVDRHARQLLQEKVGYAGMNMTWLANTELFKLEPQFALEASQLYQRAVQSKLPKVSDRAIDVRKVLRERVRLKHKVNHYRRII